MSKVLIVDDSHIDTEIIKHQVESAGYTVAAIHAPLNAIQRAKEEKPDIILLDIMMDTANGFEICARLKTDKATKHIPIIFVSSSRDENSIIKGMHIGCVDFIQKPIDKKELIDSIEIHQHMAAINKALADMAKILEG